MTWVAGIDLGSTYAKAVVLDETGRLRGRGLARTGFRLAEAAERVLRTAADEAGCDARDVAYVLSTGYGRFQVPFRTLQVTDLTAAARGTRALFPETRTVLDVGGQTVKASRLDEAGRVKVFRLNDKCAAGTGAFLEKTARYLGYETGDIGALAATSRTPVAISGVCAVFAESEVINHLSEGASPADIMQGAIVSLVDRALQLLRRVRMEPEFTLVGGILRFAPMAALMRQRIGAEVNVPAEPDVQFVAALGAATLALRRLREAGVSGEFRADAREA